MQMKQSSLLTKTFKGFKWMLFGSVGQAIIQILVLTVMARLLEPRDFGVVSLAIAVIGVSSIFSQMGVGPALVQRNELEERHVHAAFTFSIVFGLVLSLLLIVFAPLFGDFFNDESLIQVLQVTSILFPIQGLSVVAESLLQRNLMFKSIASISFTTYLVGFGVVGVLLGLTIGGVWTLVIAHIVQQVLRSSFLLIRFSHSKKINFDLATYKELMYFGGGFTIARFANYFALQGDNFVAGKSLGTEALGLYGRAYQLMAMPANLVGQVLDKVLFPVMARYQEDREMLGRVLLRGVAFMSILIMPASSFFIIFANDIVLLLLGTAWTGVVEPFRILALGMFFRVGYKLGDSMTRAKGVVYKRAWRHVIYAVMVLSGAIIGQYWGITGVSVGVLIALFLNFINMSNLSLRLTETSWLSFIKVFLIPLTITIIISITLSLENYLFSIYDVNAITEILIAIISFIIIVLLLILKTRIMSLNEHTNWIILAIKEQLQALTNRRGIR